MLRRPARSLFVASVCLAAAVLSGCAGGGVSSPKVVTPAAFEAGAASDPALSPQVLDAWWRLYDDPQLTALIEEALRASPDARTGLQRIREYRAARDQTLAGYLPQGDLQGSAQEQHTTETFGGLGVTTGLTGGTGVTSTGTTGTTGSSDALLTVPGDLQTYAAAFNVSYEVDLFGRRRAAKRAADADLWTQRFDYEATRSSLATNVANDLFQARGDAIQLAEAKDTLRIAQQLANSADVSAAHGLTSTSDAARLESDAATDAAEVARLEAVARDARRTLLDLIGRGTASIDSLVVEPTAAAPPAPPATTPGELLRRRPDVREAQARLQSAAGTLGPGQARPVPGLFARAGNPARQDHRRLRQFQHHLVAGAQRHSPRARPAAAPGHRAWPARPGRRGRDRLREGGAGRLPRRRERPDHPGLRPPARRQPADRGGPRALRLRRQAAGL